MTESHTIKKEIVDLEISLGMDAFYLQHKVSLCHQRKIVPLLERVFTEFAGTEEVLQLERLEIDLGMITVKQLENEDWDLPLEAQLRQQLQHLLVRGPQMAASLPRHETIFRQWLFYMERGYLPWNCMRPSADWHVQVQHALGAGSESRLLLRKAINNNPQVGIRMVQQHGADFLSMVVESFIQHIHTALPHFVNQVVALCEYLQQHHAADFQAPHVNDAVVWRHAIDIAAAAPSNLAATALEQQVLTALFTAAQIHLLQQLRASGALPAPLATILGPSHADRSPGTGEAAAGSLQPPRDSAAAENQAAARENLASIPPNPGETNKSEHSDLYDGEPQDVYREEAYTDDLRGEEIFVEHAGLVVIHPFLSRFFTRIGYLEEGKFLEHDKALYVLHFLATGLQTAAEYELVIAKLLCAYPLGKAAEKDVVLEDWVLEEAESLLHAVIEQWSILQRTSIAGLREGFLQRAGKLHFAEEKTRLLVEPHSIDVLLDYLPWPLSMVRLPWMKGLLHVEWR